MFICFFLNFEIQSVTRAFNRFVNYVLKGFFGTAFLVMVLPPLFLMCSLLSVFLAVTSPIYVSTFSALVHLLAFTCFDFEGMLKCIRRHNLSNKILSRSFSYALSLYLNICRCKSTDGNHMECTNQYLVGRCTAANMCSCSSLHRVSYWGISNRHWCLYSQRPSRRLGCSSFSGIL